MSNKKNDSIAASSNCCERYSELVSQITNLESHYQLLSDPDSLRSELDKLYYNAVCNDSCDALEPYDRGHMFVLIHEIADFMNEFAELTCFAAVPINSKPNLNEN